MVVETFYKKSDVFYENEPMITFDRFAAHCTDYNLFSEDSQWDFLDVYNKDDLKLLYNDIKSEWITEHVKLLFHKKALTSLTEQENKNWDDNVKELDKRFTEAKDGVHELLPTVIAFRIACRELVRIKDEDEADQKNYAGYDIFNPDKYQAHNMKHSDLSSEASDRTPAKDGNVDKGVDIQIKKASVFKPGSYENLATEEPDKGCSRIGSTNYLDIVDEKKMKRIP